MSVTKKKIDESAFIIAKDNITNNVQTVVVPSNFQVGLKTSPSDLTLTGKFSTSEKDYVANSSNNWTLSLEDHVTVSSISTTYSSSSQPSAGYVVINLPKNPRVGQLVIIKEFSGTASVISLRIYDASSKTIDGTSYKTISSDYGALQFFWQGNNWISISNATVASGAAPDSASYVVIGSNAILTNERTLAAGSGISIVDGGAGAAVTISATGGGSGDVIGPASSTDNAIVRFDLTTGKLIQNSGVMISDTNNITTPGDLAVNGGDITSTASTFNLLNSTVTTLNVAGAATSVTLGASTSTTTIGQSTLGTWPGGTTYAYFSHKDATSTGYALLQASPAGTKNTWLNAPSGGQIRFANNDVTIGYMDDNEVSLTGKVSTSTTTTLGNTYGSSATTINAGTGDLNLDAVDLIQFKLNGTGIGYLQRDLNVIDPNGPFYYNTIEIGNNALLSYQPNYVTVGSSNYNSSLSLRAGTGDINVGTSNDARTTNICTGAASQTINIATGAAAHTISIGSSTGASEINLNAGTGLVTITSNTSTAPDAKIGNLAVGTHPYWGVNYAMVGHSSLSHAGLANKGNYGLIQKNDGTTWLNASSGKKIYLANNDKAVGYIDNDEISLTGSTGIATTTTLGSTTGASSTTINAGTGDLNLDAVDLIQFKLNGNGVGYLQRSLNVIDPNGPFYYNTIRVGNNALLGYEPNYVTVGSSNYNSSLTLDAGTGVIDIGTSNDARTTSICTGAAAQTINIGTGAAAHTIAVGSTTGASSLTLNAGTGLTTINSHAAIARTALISYPSDTVTDYPMQLKVVTGGNTIRWAIGADTGSDLNFSYSLNSTTVASKGYLSNTVDVAAIDFTGQHRNYPVGGNVLDFSDKIGLIVASVGRYKSLTSSSAEISINEALPMVELSTKRNQKSVFGVISDHEDPNETSREYVIGNWGSVYEKMQNDDRLIINSLGEGAIWICNVNGNLQNGDYITSCEVPGYGMKQDDDVLHNYTVAKITCDCDFSLDSTVYQCEEFRHEGKTYRRAFVGCTYHCG